MKPDDGGNGVDEGVMGSNQYFDDLFTEIESELYPRYIKLSSLNFLVKLMHLKVSNIWTNKSFDSLIKLLKDVLPKENRLPISHYGAKKNMSKLGLGYESINVYKYDCALFWKEHTDKNVCLICGTSRWVDDNSKEKMVPHKFLHYFPLTPRLKRLYGCRHTTKEMRWHYTNRLNDECVLHHPADGKVRKN